MKERKGMVAVFTDVLRCTTTCLAAVAEMELKGIVLKRKPQGSSFKFQPTCYPNQPWIFGGEKNGMPIKGYDSNNEEVEALNQNSLMQILIEYFFLVIY